MQRRLARFRVNGLFGLYNHDIPLNRTSHVTAVIGLNGIGKTISLKLIDAIFNGKFSIFYATKFDNCDYYFTDGSRISVGRAPNASAAEGEPQVRLLFRLEQASGDEVVWDPQDSLANLLNRAPDLGQFIPYITQIGPKTYRHDTTGERLTHLEIFERFGHHLPKSLIVSWERAGGGVIRKFLSGLNCHLIQTERLSVPNPATNMEHAAFYRRSASESTRLAVERKSETLKSAIKNVLASYGSLSSSLDRTFPNRIVHDKAPRELDPEVLRTKLGDLEERRVALEAAGILEREPNSFTQVPSDTALRRVISIYVEDTTSKLDVFSDLQRKIQVFEELFQSRLTDKSIAWSKADGLVVTSTTGQVIPLGSLSSGEQHQLVVIFELLFETQQGDLILIDEPELSLHVAWQRSFIEDLLKIIEANPLDAVLATHSPTLIGRHFDLAVELGDRHDEKSY